MSQDDLRQVRERRARRAAVALNLVSSGAGHELQSPSWQQLSDLPDWCLWPEGPRAQLVRVAGALFAAPGMRLWIDAARLQAARALIGDRLFDAVMSSPVLPSQAPSVPSSGDLARLLDTAGRAVLLGSLGAAWMRSFIAPRLPAADAQAPLCPAAVARPLTAQALALLASMSDETRPAPIVLREPGHPGKGQV